MTAGAGTSQPKRTHRPGRIIERPRLIKQLDAAEAPVILIVGPAGYGKTTLARQWARTLSGVIWVACTPSHRDVVTFSEDVAAGIDALGGNASRFIGEYMRARSNPQRAAREIAMALAKKLEEAPVQWLVIDDYQELAQSPEAEEMVAVLRAQIRARILVASRVHPKWATARDLVYGAVAEIGADELALTSDETKAILGARPELEVVVRRARGWPAVVGLAAGLSGLPSPDPSTSALHRFVADELYQTAAPTLRAQLIDLALLPDLSLSTMRGHFGDAATDILAQARDLGFVTGDVESELHPLLREFLLTKLGDARNAAERVRKAVATALDLDAWDLAFDLVLRFGLYDLVDPALRRAFKALAQSGRLETLSRFATEIKGACGSPTPATDVVDAEAALRDGKYDLAASIADRAHSLLPEGHELKCRASLIAGRAHFFRAAFADSLRAYHAASEEAADSRDQLESAFGLATTQVFGEQGDPAPALARVRALRHVNPTSLVRYATAELNIGRFADFAAEAPLAEGVEALPLTPDPNVRTAFTYTSAYLLCCRGEYRRAVDLLRMFERDIDEFELDFARPFFDWTQAFVDLGLRRFGDADRRLQRVEDAAAEQHHKSHDLNARILRARLMLQTGEASAAVDLLRVPPEATVFPSWLGELKATEALGLACLGLTRPALETAESAISTSRFVEVFVLAQAARAVAAAQRSDDTELQTLFAAAAKHSVWDPVICALRSSREFATRAAASETLRPQLRQLLHRAEDTVLARQLGLPMRTAHRPDVVLSPRELEVLGLMARGMRNKEIAAALFVAESTIKVHIRHIFEKLGVDSRAAAVARFERTART